MEISLDQVRALIAIAETGSIVAASKKLHKTHTAILYQIKQLEIQVGFSLLDRQQYKAALTPQAEEFLLEARRFILAEDRLCEKAKHLKEGGLGRWHLIYDAIFPLTELLTIVSVLQTSGPLSIRLLGDSLRAVEKTFWQEESDFMLSVFPPVQKDLITQELGSLRSFFVVTKGYSLNISDLSRESLILVRGVEPQLVMGTDQLHWGNKLVVNDFQSKKEAILRGLGVGWLPEYLVHEEIKKKALSKMNGPLFRPHEFKIYYSARKSLATDPLFEKTLFLLKKSKWLR